MSALPPHVSRCCRVILSAWLLSAGSLPAQQAAPKIPPALPKDAAHPVKPEMELLITHPAVLNSAAAHYPGVLSFGHVMEQLAGPGKAAAFTLAWLNLWTKDQLVNGDVAPARPRIRELVLETWRKQDQQANDEDDDPLAWTPNLEHAPFKLIAVVNRMDLVATSVVAAMKTSAEDTQKKLAFLAGDGLALATPPANRDFTEMTELFRRNSPEGENVLALLKAAKNTPLTPRKLKTATLAEFVALEATGPVSDLSAATGYYTGSLSGEGRLVFALTDAEGTPLEPGFNVIFEYSLPAPAVGNNPSAPVKRTVTEQWAARWHQLGTHAQFDDDYLHDLVAVTKGFTEERAGTSAARLSAAPTLSQVRTNDGVLDAVREFRQFRFVDSADTHPLPRLQMAPVSQTPAERFHVETNARTLLAKILKTRVEDFQKELPVTIPAAVRLRRDTELVGLLGARALLPGDPLEFRWAVPGVREKALVQNLSAHTCNGCHGGDTHCQDGCHLKASPNDLLGTVASSFLASNSDGVPAREMKDRAYILNCLLQAERASSKVALLKLLHQRHRGTH